MSPPNSYTEILTLNEMGSIGGAFKGLLGQEGGVLMNGISDLIRDLRKLPHYFQHGRTQPHMHEKAGPHWILALPAKIWTSHAPEL